MLFITLITELSEFDEVATTIDSPETFFQNSVSLKVADECVLQLGRFVPSMRNTVAISTRLGRVKCNDHVGLGHDANELPVNANSA